MEDVKRTETDRDRHQQETTEENYPAQRDSRKTARAIKLETLWAGIARIKPA
jgi:hypothetical protein